MGHARWRTGPFGGGVVEVDETFIGQDPDAPPSKMAIRNKNAVMTLIDRETGRGAKIVGESRDSGDDPGLAGPSSRKSGCRRPV